MEHLISQFEKVYIDVLSVESELAQRIHSLFPKEQIEVVAEKPLGHISGTLSADEFSKSKRLLYVTEHKGHFFKRCPGAKPGLTCCNYFVLNLGLQCNMNCSYCYLQSYINTPVLTIFSNIDRALNELKDMAESYPDRGYRVGTGETTDSLGLDDLTLYSRKLITFFKKYPNWKLEFKTKSDKVDQFLDVEHSGNVICSWSMNPQNVIEREEHLTASLDQRLSAAKKCLDKKFRLSFHFDPMIWHPEWKNSYFDLIQKICANFKPEDVEYITVGALRFQPEQRHMMRERFGMNSLVTQAEVFTGKDGKMRYDLEIRNEMFEFIRKQFNQQSRSWRVSLCMEVPETWSLTMASSPRQMPELKELFAPVPTNC